MKKISALIIAAAGVLNAQTYDYDPSSETLVITGKGNSVADRISFEGPTTPGSTVPGSTEIFGDTKTIILKDVWSSPDSIRVKYIEPTSAGNGTTLKLINSRLGASGDFDMGGSGQTLILDAQSSLNLYGNRLTNTTRIESDGYIETVNGTVSKSSYLWDNKTGTGSSGVLGGRGYYDFGNVSSIDTDKDFGLIKSRGRITDLEISGEYTVGGDSGKTLGDDSFFAGVNAEDTTGGQAMTISGKLTVAAKQGTGIGVRANQLGDDDVSLENNYSGEITVRAKDAFGVKVGGNAAKDAATAGDIHSISIGTLNVESTASGSDTGTATGIYAKSVKRGLTANSITVKDYTDAAGIQLTEGGRNLSITDMKVSAGADGTATGILASASVGAGVSSMGDLENINVGNLEVSGGADAAGILAKSVLGRVDNISASSTNGTANGIHADTIDITVGCKISASSENGDADGILADNDIKLTILDGAEISATAENGEAFAIRSASGNIDLNFAGTATINGNVNAKDITLSNGGLATINGDVEGDNLAAGAEIGTVSWKMKFDTVADLTVATSVGSLEIGTAESITAAKIAGDATVDTVSGKLTVAEGKNITINVSAGELLLGTVENLNVAKVNGTTDIITATGDVIINDGGDVFVRDSAGSLMLGKVGNVGAAKVVGSTTIDQAGDVTIIEGGDVTVNTSADSLSLGTVESVYAAKVNGGTVINEALADVHIVEGQNVSIGTAGSLALDKVGDVGVAKVNGETTIEEAGNVIISEGKDVVVNVSVDSLTLGTVDKVRVAKVDGTTDIITATGNVKIDDGKDVFVRDSAGSLELGKVENVGVAKVNGDTVIGEAKDITIIDGKNVWVNVSADSLTLGKVDYVEAIKINGDTVISEASQTVRISEGQNVTIGSANMVELGKVANVGIAKINGNANIDEAGDITIVEGKGITVSTSANSLSLGKVESVYAEKVGGATSINEASQGVRIIDGQDVTIGSAGWVRLGKVGDVGIVKVDGSTVIGEAKDITIVEGGDITVNTSADSLALGKVGNVYAAKVNGDTIIEEASQNVHIVDGQNASIGSAGSLNVDKLGGNLTVAQVGETAVDSVVGDVVIGTATGNVSVSNSSSATVVNASGDISATNISNGLTVGNVGNVNVSNADVNVLDGGTLGGDIVSSTDLTLTNGGTATIAGSVSAGSNRLTIGSAFNVNSSAATVISAGTLSGAGLRDTINNHYDSAFGFSATDDSAGTLTAATSLKGVHNVSSNNITGTIEGDLASVENAYTKIKYVNVGNNVGYEVESNTYLTDAVATNETERAYAEIYDNLEYVEGDDAANATSVAKKRNFVAMVNGGTLGALNPQSVVHGVRMNMDLADIIHLDTLNRTSSSADALAAADHAERPSGDANITVRNINRFASYGGDGNIDGSNDYISGGLVNVEYAVNREFFAGLGAGGFQSKSTGKGNCGKAETQSFAVNAYADWRFFDNFDWYFGATYAFGMNEAERANIVDRSKAEWDSNLVGVFTGVRYAWKPFLDREFYVKPTIGANANFLMNPSFDEKSGAERMHFDSDRYTSVKSLVGIEATYALANGFYFAGRMFYTHEFCDERYDVNSMFGATAIRTRGWEMDRNAGVFGAGLGYNITDQWRVYADYAAEVSGRVYHNLNAGIQFRF